MVLAPNTDDPLEAELPKTVEPKAGLLSEVESSLAKMPVLGVSDDSLPPKIGVLLVEAAPKMEDVEGEAEKRLPAGLNGVCFFLIICKM